MADSTEAVSKVRLQVLLARCGLGSRRNCEEFIQTGRVTVDGETVTALGARVNLSSRIAVDGELLRPEQPAYYMVNKPKGVLCTNDDPSGRTRVIDLFPDNAGRLFPVGRLDENSVGLLLVTNDGELSHALAHPKFQVPKIYHVQVAGIPTLETLQTLRRGLYFDGGRFAVKNAKRLKVVGRSSVLEVTLAEGHNREIRRLFAKVGHKVMKLERVQFGPLQLRGVATGKYRRLTPAEIKLLHKYIEDGDARRSTPQTADDSDSGDRRPQRPPRPRTASPKAPPKTVEIGPLGVGNRGRDFTGQRRVSDDEPRPARHPAQALPSKARQVEIDPIHRGGPSRKPRVRNVDPSLDDDYDDDDPRPAVHPALMQRPGGARSGGAMSGSARTGGTKPAGAKPAGTNASGDKASGKKPGGKKPRKAGDRQTGSRGGQRAGASGGKSGGAKRSKGSGTRGGSKSGGRSGGRGR